MSKMSNREKIITEGLRVVHEYGYAGASVRDISRAAGVPLGSFTNHFSSKEAFGLEILERYYLASQAIISTALGDKAKSVRDRLELYFDYVIDNLLGPDFRSGCLLGNLSAEVTNQSDALRLRLADIVEERQGALSSLLQEGKEAGELPADLDIEGASGFIYFSLQGAILMSKLTRSAAPVNNCRQQVMTYILRLT